MKFIHMADLHLDAPFVNLAGRENFSNQRRLEQRQAMKQVIDYIKENNIPYLFISGDLYEQEYIRKSTIEYINNLFKQIPETKVYITPGNHDPYINNSFYKQFSWSENIHIFKDELDVIHTTEADIYGYGFSDFYMQNKYKNIEIENKEKINILITHGSLDGGNDENREYNPMSSKELKESGFDYIALGHIHKKSYNDYPNQKIVYPGSTVSLGFDELGKRGVILGEITNESKKLQLKFIEIETKTFEEKEINITDVESNETLIEKLNDTKFDDNKFYKIILIGKKDFEINIKEILELTKHQNIIKIKDNTSIKYNMEEIAEQISLKGLFAKKIMQRINSEESEENKQKAIEAFEMGMNILSK